MTLAATYRLPRGDSARAISVLHVRTVAGNGGGPEKTLLHGGRYLSALGVRAEALYLLDAHARSDNLLGRIREAAMPIHVVRERSGLDPAGAGALARLVRRGQFDIVHTHDYKSNTLARVLIPAGNYRIVATAHGYNQTTGREACYYALERLLLRRADAVICPSRSLADLLAESGVSRHRLHVISNGIDMDEWPFRPRPSRSGPLRLLYVGRLSPEKNTKGLLSACALLVRAGRHLHLRVAGEGPQRDALQHFAGQLGLNGSVEWLGQCNDVAALLAETDVFVCPSHTESLPNTVIEALACGAPVVATDVGGTDELILHEQTGVLTPPGQTQALADAIGRLDDDPDFAQRLAFAGRSHVEQNFDFGIRMAHVVALYRGVLAAGGGR